MHIRECELHTLDGLPLGPLLDLQLGLHWCDIRDSFKLQEPSSYKPMAWHVRHFNCKSPAGNGQRRDMCDTLKLQDPSWHQPTARHVRQLQTVRTQLALTHGVTCVTTPDCKSPAGISQWRNICYTFSLQEPSWHRPTARLVRQRQPARTQLA